MTLQDPSLVRSLQLAYSAEKAAAFAYIGHARSLRNPEERATVHQIEEDEWEHRRNVYAIMQLYGIPVSRWLEIKFHIIGRLISFSCYFIGRFMPYFFAGKLESGNVCEYFVMIHKFHALGISEHDPILQEMGVKEKEKEHEVYFLNIIRHEKWLPLFEKVFNWGTSRSLNDLPDENDVENLKPDQVYTKFKR